MKPTIGIQLYTLRDFIQTAEDFDMTLGRLEKLGVSDVQISAIGDIPAPIQADILKKHGMSVCVTHKGFDRMLTDLDTMIDEHKTIGCDAMGIGSAPSDCRDTYSNVINFIENAGKVGARLKECGMTFNYHNHDFEFKTLEGADCSMMELLLTETDPDTFRFIPDIAWIHYAGADPLEILHRMKGRVKVVHFKDYIIDEKGERHFVSLGKGVVNLGEVYDLCCEFEIPHIVYEQDNDWSGGDPFKATEESWEYLKSL